MMNREILSIVTPTRGELDAGWLEALFRIRGDVEFIFVLPPEKDFPEIEDDRVRLIRAPYAGEVMQRAMGLLCARGKYVLALDDDDFVHPGIVELVKSYWETYPEAWVLRLRKKALDVCKREDAFLPWLAIPDIKGVKKEDDGELDPKRTVYEVPVVPLDRPFDWKAAFLPFRFRRKDHQGRHMENFVDRVWDGDMVRAAARSFFASTHLAGPLKYIPPRSSFGFDRVVSLLLQAIYYEEKKVIGYWMPKEGEQIRKIERAQGSKPPRFHVFSHFLLVKHYPFCSYFWNLFLEKLYGAPRSLAKKLIAERDKNEN